MKNFRIHEALCHLFPNESHPYPWVIEQGPHTGWEIKIVKWDLQVQQPTQEQLDAAYSRLEEIDRQKELEKDVPLGEVDRLIAQFLQITIWL